MKHKKQKSSKKDIPENKTKLLEDQLEAMMQNWKRAVADYQNLEKRTKAEKESFAGYATQQLIERLLPVLDTFELASLHMNNEGLQLAIDGFLKVLHEEGLVKIETKNKQFDPVEMECIELLAEGQENEVIEEVRAGYKLNDKIVRPVQVKVGKGKILNPKS